MILFDLNDPFPRYPLPPTRAPTNPSRMGRSSWLIFHTHKVVVVAGGNQAGLASLNAKMRRIDLVCKLIGPLFIALIDGYSTKVAITVNFAMNVASIAPEYLVIAQVYRWSPDLQEPRTTVPPSGEAPPRASMASDFVFYLRHHAFLPSFATALLYLTVLSFAGQMVTYLAASGYTSEQISIARTVSVVFEVLATWVAPWLLGRIGLVRAALWFSSWQLAMLVVNLVVFWVWESEPLVSNSGLVIGTILSRLGLRGFDICAQIIVQEVCLSLSLGQAALTIVNRMSRRRTAAGFRPSRRPGKTPLSSSPMCQPWPSIDPSSSSGLR